MSKPTTTRCNKVKVHTSRKTYKPDSSTKQKYNKLTYSTEHSLLWVILQLAKIPISKNVSNLFYLTLNLEPTEMSKLKHLKDMRSIGRGLLNTKILLTSKCLHKDAIQLDQSINPSIAYKIHRPS